MDKAPLVLYPKLTVEHIKNPNKLWAIPILGFIAKVVILLPVWISLGFVGIAVLIISIVNSFSVLFKGEYMDLSHKLNLGFMRLSAKSTFFLFGLTDKYPGLNFGNEPLIKLEIEKPKNPNKLFALPVLGGVARFILMLPFFIYAAVLGNGSWVGAALSWVAVLFKSRYPESTYEFTRDSIRVSSGLMSYLLGLSDKYPSFWISMNHQTIKILLIIVGALYTLANWSGKYSSNKPH